MIIQTTTYAKDKPIVICAGNGSSRPIYFEDDKRKSVDNYIKSTSKSTGITITRWI